MPIQVHDMSRQRWSDLEDLFGAERGANSGCWCMWWRMSRADWQEKDRAGRKAGLKRVISSGQPVGVLAYEDDRAVGWCAVGPRASLPALQRSRVARSATDQSDADIWFINCFYVRAGYRRRGLMQSLAEAAVDFARRGGAHAVEACPIDTQRGLQWGEGFVGLAPVFRRLGFREIERRTPARPLMRFELR